MSSILVVGIGPGDRLDMTGRALLAIDSCDVICGYHRYVELLGDMAEKKPVIATGMRGERQRCLLAIESAREGNSVAVICSGDAGVYGMAGLIYELLAEGGYDIPVEVVPGVTAALSGAAVLGAPLMNDFAVISLSDILTPRELIEKRLKGVSQADMVCVLYNPMSQNRPDNLSWACDIMQRYKGDDTVCGWVRNIGRQKEEARILTLGELRDEKLDMLCTVFVGSQDTLIIDGRMVTKRGYGI